MARERLSRELAVTDEQQANALQPIAEME